MGHVQKGFSLTSVFLCLSFALPPPLSKPSLPFSLCKSHEKMSWGEDKKRERKRCFNRLTDTENRLMVARGERGWGTGWRGEGTEKCRWVVTGQSWGCEGQQRDGVNNIVITMYSAGGYWEYQGEYLIKHMIV